MNAPHSYIVHLCQRSSWQAGSGLPYRADSLNQEGFIHCSRPGQILAVANRFYFGVQGLVLLWIDPQKVAADIRWEPVEGQTFPHIYGTINRDAVVAVTPFPCDQDGSFRAFQQPELDS